MAVRNNNRTSKNANNNSKNRNSNSSSGKGGSKSGGNGPGSSNRSTKSKPAAKTEKAAAKQAAKTEKAAAPAATERSSLSNLNWYPGHMKKTREMIQENLKVVDAVIEVIDARIPVASRNPIVDELISEKTRIVVLNKTDLADDNETDRWTEHFRRQGHYACGINCGNGMGINKLLRYLDEIQEKRDQEKTRKRPLRLMIVGVPNVGKSSLINRLTGRKSAQTGDRPGVTKGKQWLTLANGMQLLDTPGILWPKFEDPKVGIDLAFCGSIKDEIMDLETLCLEFIKVMISEYKDLLAARYKLEDLSDDGLEAMEQIALKRGFIFPGKRIDYSRTARTVLDEFRGGMIGKITLETIK